MTSLLVGLGVVFGTVVVLPLVFVLWMFFLGFWFSIIRDIVDKRF